MGARTSLKKVYKIIIKTKLARELGISYQSIDRWISEDSMPCTDFSGKTRYARKIEIITEGRVTVEDLLGWRPPHQIESKD